MKKRGKPPALYLDHVRVCLRRHPSANPPPPPTDEELRRSQEDANRLADMLGKPRPVIYVDPDDPRAN